jgi:2'-5' RNA ligase
MTEQIALPGFGPEPASRASKKKLKPTDRLFFAVLPDAEAIAAIHRCKEQLQLQSGSSIIDGRLHVSLLWLGDFAGMQEFPLEAVSQAAAMISLAAFDVCFDRALTFGKQTEIPKENPTVLVESAASQSLITLRRLLIAPMQKLKLAEKAPSSFKAHITLLYSRLHLKEIDAVPVTWKVKEFVLVHSKIGPGRPYDIVGRWPLVDPQNVDAIDI